MCDCPQERELREVIRSFHDAHHGSGGGPFSKPAPIALSECTDPRCRSLLSGKVTGATPLTSPSTSEKEWETFIASDGQPAIRRTPEKETEPRCLRCQHLRSNHQAPAGCSYGYTGMDVGCRCPQTFSPDPAPQDEKG